jgi:hypothetical protein
MKSNTEIGTWKSWTGQDMLDCGKRSQLPQVTLTLGGHAFTLSADEYVLQVHRKCISAFVGVDNCRQQRPAGRSGPLVPAPLVLGVRHGQQEHLPGAGQLSRSRHYIKEMIRRTEVTKVDKGLRDL